MKVLNVARLPRTSMLGRPPAIDPIEEFGKCKSSHAESACLCGRAVLAMNDGMMLPQRISKDLAFRLWSFAHAVRNGHLPLAQSGPSLGVLGGQGVGSAFKRGGLSLASTNFVMICFDCISNDMEVAEQMRIGAAVQAVADIVQDVARLLHGMGFSAFVLKTLTPDEIDAEAIAANVIAYSDHPPHVSNEYAMVEIRSFPAGNGESKSAAFIRPTRDSEARLWLQSASDGSVFSQGAVAVARVAAHELYHSIQFESGYTTAVTEGLTRGEELLTTFWIEGTATLVGAVVEWMFREGVDALVDPGAKAELAAYLMDEPLGGVVTIFGRPSWDWTVPLWQGDFNSTIPYQTADFFAAVDTGDVSYLAQLQVNAVLEVGNAPPGTTRNDNLFEALRVALGRDSVAELYAIALRNKGRVPLRNGTTYVDRGVLTADGISIISRYSNGSVLLLCPATEVRIRSALYDSDAPQASGLPLVNLQAMSGQSVRLYFRNTQVVRVTLALGFGQDGSYDAFHGLQDDGTFVADPAYEGAGQSDLFVAVESGGEPRDDMRWVVNRPQAGASAQFRTIPDPGAFGGPAMDESYITLDVMNIETFILEPPDDLSELVSWLGKAYSIVVARVR